MLSQIYTTGNVIVFQENNISISDSLIQPAQASNAIIFVSSAIVFSELQDVDHYEVVDISSFDTEKIHPQKSTAQNKIKNLTAGNTKKVQQVEPQITIKCLVSSQPIKLSYFSHSGKSACTVISGSDHTIKFLPFFPNNSLKEFKFSKNRSGIFLYADDITSNHHLTSLSVRPPPFFS